MSYIKINKDYLDYDYYAMFHSYTMNNFVRNVMRKGKYKKAVKIVRLGLIGAMKRIYNSLRNNVLTPYFRIPLNFKRVTPTFLSEESLYNIQKELSIPLDSDYIEDILRVKFKKQSKIKAFEKYIELVQQEDRTLIDEILNPSENIELRKELIPLRTQYEVLRDDLSFQKIYTKIPSILYYKNRQYTIFDLVIQVYGMLANIWYMKKIKVSGRTVLVPTPLRNYRRVSVVTQMIMKGLKKLRRQERFVKKAMINTIGQEFWRLVLYYNPVNSHPTITASYIWLLKEQSHKELVANLKNVKHANYL